MSDDQLEHVVFNVEDLRRKKGRVILAIDGRGGAGKSSLARNLTSRLPHSAHIEHDWFHLPREKVTEDRRFDHARLIAEVISPFRSGNSVLTCYRYNWGFLAGVPDGFHDTPVTIEDTQVLILEGCETLHAELFSHFDITIWLDTAAEVSLARGIKRDIEEYKLDPNTVRQSWKEWSEWEHQALARDDRRKRAGFLLQG